METADLGQFHDLARAGRLDRPRVGCVLAQGQMRPRPMVVGEIGLQDPVQVPLTEDDDPIEALATDGSHQALGIRILPG
jgi:hypothetical protein